MPTNIPGVELAGDFQAAEEDTTVAEFAARTGGASDPTIEGDFVSSVGRFAREFPVRTVLGGVRDAGQEVLNSTFELSQFLEEKIPLGTLGEPITGEAQNPELPDVSEPTTAGGQVSRDILQFVSGFVPALKGVKGLGASMNLSGKTAKLVEGEIAGAVAAGVALDPHEARLSNLINEYPDLKNPVTEFLEAKPGDTAAEGRLKNAVEGLAIAPVAQGFVSSLRAMRGIIKSKRQIAKQEAERLGRTIDEQTEQGFTEAQQKALGGNPKAPLIEPVSADDAESFLNTTGRDLPKDGKAFNINLSRLQTEKDVKKAVAEVAERFRADIDEARRGKISQAETEQLANDLGMTPQQLLERRQGTAFNAEEALAARKILVSSAENLHRIREQVLQGATDDASKFAFYRAITLHKAIQEQVSGVAAEAGRALNAFKIGARSNKALQQQLNEVMADRSGDARELAERLTALETPEQLATGLRQIEDVSMADIGLEWWINGLLSGPQTHAVNALSNSLVAAWQVPERFLASGISKMLATENGVQVGEAAAQAYGLVQGFKNGLVTAGRVLKTGEPTDQLTKLEAARHKAITAENVAQTMIGRGVKKITPKSFRESGLGGAAVTGLGKSINAAGEVVRLPGRFLMAEDEFFKSIGYRMELNALAYRTAKNEGLTGTQMASRIREIINDPPEGIDMASVDASRYQTFTKQLGEGGRKIQQLTNLHPTMKLVAPFIRTPVNIMKFAGERTPLSVMSKSVRESIKAGGAKRDIQLARLSMGSMTMLSIMDFASEGQITGAGPSDPELRAEKFRTGWQPYSMNINGEWHSFSRLEPLGTLFGVAADLQNIMGQLEEGEREEIAAAVTMAVSKNVTEKTFLQGLSNATLALAQPDRYGESFLQKFAGSAVPSVSAQIERIVDPELREVRSMTDQLMSRIPGYSDQLPARVNVWGEKIELGGGLGPDIVSPIYTSRHDPHPIDAEIDRLDVGLTMPTEQIRGIGLKPEEYNQYARLAGNELKQNISGKQMGAFDFLNDLAIGIHPDKNLQNVWNQGGDQRRTDIVKEVVFSYRRAAASRMIEENPALAIAIQMKAEREAQQQ